MPIINDIMERKPNYCHVLEVEDIFELQSIIENLVDEFTDNYSADDIIEFFNTIEIYSLNDANDDAIYDFNVEAYVMNFLH